MCAQGIDVLDKADRDHVALGVADDLELQFFPAEDRFLDEHLSDEACLQTTRADCAKFFLIVDESAACAAHGVCGAQHDRISESVGDGKRLIDAVGDLASRHLDADGVHGFLELDAVLAALDGIDLHADHLHVVLVKDAFLGKLGTEV